MLRSAFIVVEDLFAVRDGNSAFVGDARYFPLVIVTWFGEMTEPLARRYFEWQDPILERVIAEKTKFAFVADTTRCARPSPKMRKLVVELSNAGPSVAAYALPTYTAIESALVRGAITAMQWVVNIDWRIVPVPTARQGLQKAIAALLAEGVKVPRGIDPDTYRAPEMPASSTAAMG
jgi:hypothetical protein